MELGHIKAGSRSGSPAIDARSLEAMLEPLLKKFDDRLEKRTREMADLLAANLLNERCQVVDKQAPGSTPVPMELSKASSVEACLVRIEEQVDMNTRLLDRSRTECTIVSCLAKLEQQNVDIKKLLYEGSGDDSFIKSALTRIEERLDDGKGLVLQEIGAELSALESVLQRIDKQLGSTTNGREN